MHTAHSQNRREVLLGSLLQWLIRFVHGEIYFAGETADRALVEPSGLQARKLFTRITATASNQGGFRKYSTLTVHWTPYESYIYVFLFKDYTDR